MNPRLTLISLPELFNGLQWTESMTEIAAVVAVILCNYSIDLILFFNIDLPSGRFDGLGTMPRGSLPISAFHMHIWNIFQFCLTKVNYVAQNSFLPRKLDVKILNVNCLHFICCQRYTTFVINHASYQLHVNDILPFFPSLLHPL